MSVIEPNACYSKSEACEALGVSGSTLQRYFAKGLKVRRPTGRIHILGSDILDFLKADHGTEDADDAPVISSKLETRLAKAVLDIRKGKRPAAEAAGR